MSTDDRAHLFRIEWLPGDDLLVGVCFCGAQQTDDEPKPLWAWLFAHPDGHDVRPAQAGSPRDSRTAEAVHV
jgi:hypothetical protein